MVHKQGGNGGNRNGNGPDSKSPGKEKQVFRKKHLTSIPGGRQDSRKELEFREHLQERIEGLKRESSVLQREIEQAGEMLSAMEPQIQESNEILQNQIGYSEDLQARLEAPFSAEKREELRKELDTCYHHIHKNLESMDQMVSEYNMVAAQIDLTEKRLGTIISRIHLLEQHLALAGGPVSLQEKADAGENPGPGNNHHQPSFGVSAEERNYAQQAQARRADLEAQASSGEEPEKKKTGNSADYTPSISLAKAIKSTPLHFSKFMEKPVRHILGLVFKGPGRIIKLGLLGVAGVAGVSGWSAGNKVLNAPEAATWSSFGKDLWNSSIENLKAVKDLSFDGALFLYNHAFEVSCGLGALWTATGIFQPTPSKKFRRASFGTAIMAISTAAMDMFHNTATGARNMLEVVDFSDSLTLAAISAASYVASKCVPDMEMPEGRVGKALKAIPGYIGKGVAWPFRKLAKGIKHGAAAAGKGIAYSAKKLAEGAKYMAFRAFKRLEKVPPTQEMPAHMAPDSEEATRGPEGDSGEGSPLPETEEFPQEGSGSFTTEPELTENAHEERPRSGVMEIPLDDEE